MQKQENFDPKIFEDKGDFDLYQVEHEDPQTSLLRKIICEHRMKDENPRPWIKLSDTVKNVTGSADGRVWISIKGNLHLVLGYPLKMFKNYFEEEMFPTIADYAVLETFNHFAPGKYMLKFSNDIVCKEHRSKTAGVLRRRGFGYAVIILGGNLVEAPNHEKLRAEGIKACCMKDHCDKIPTPLDFGTELFKNLKRLFKEYDTVEKIVEHQNIVFNEYENNYKMSINNPNADLVKDGTFWTQEYPNALLKVDHKGMRYQYFKSDYDEIIFKVKGDPNKEKPYHLKHEYIKVDEK